MDLFRRLFSQANTKPDNSAQVEAPPPPPEVIEITPPVVGTTPLPASPAETMPPMNIADGITRPLPPETVISSSSTWVNFRTHCFPYAVLGKHGRHKSLARNAARERSRSPATKAA